MKSIKALELKDQTKEVSSKTKRGIERRQKAMQKYFMYTDQFRGCFQKPSIIEFEGEDYLSFCNSWSLALTTEACDDLDLFDPDDYPDVVDRVRFDGVKKRIDFGKVIDEAKSKGYRFKKSEVNSGFEYLFHYDGSYYKIGLLEATYRIIDQGGEVMTYHPDGHQMPLTIKNDIGLCMIMPVSIANEDSLEKEKIIVIE